MNRLKTWLIFSAGHTKGLPKSFRQRHERGPDRVTLCPRAGILKGWYDHVGQSNRSQWKSGESSEVLNRKTTREGKSEASDSRTSTVRLPKSCRSPFLHPGAP